MSSNNKAVMKRSTNETVQLLRKYPHLDIRINPKEEKFIVKINIHKLNITFVLNDYYPFKPPQDIRINNMLYFEQLQRFHPEIVRKYKGKECLCCNSVICNWKPTNKFEDVVSEVITNVNFMNSIYSNISFELRCSNGGRLGRGPSLPWEICRLIRDYLVIPVSSNKL
tara:strand:+ start:501 stop:1004 length:504 start_codon:yes stop_codon:yes gene_type:complete